MKGTRTVDVNLVNVLLNGRVESVPAKPFTEEGFYADMVFLTDIGNVKIVGEAKDLSDGAEAFYLNLRQFDEKRYWLNETGESSWPPTPGRDWSAVDLMEKWKNSAVMEIFRARRVAHFYLKREDRARGLEPIGLLHSAAAIRLVPENTKEPELVIFATPKYPCSLEISTDKERCESILRTLEEFHFL